MTEQPTGPRMRADNSGITAGRDVTLRGRDVAGRDMFHVYIGGAARESDDDRRDAEQRQRLLARVHGDYSQRLQQALDNVVRIELGLEQTPAAVYHRLDSALPRNLTPRPLSEDTSVLQVFYDSGGWTGRGLLVLGDPGAGKTTSLIELARALAEEAGDDKDHPIPVYLPLSSWQRRRPPMVTWMAERIHELYQLPLATARRWVEHDRILPLLDGLDEITEIGARAACITAINDYVGGHPIPVVVTSRRHEYKLLQKDGRALAALGTAVLIKPLEPPAVLAYLDRAGQPMAGIRAAVADDPNLLDLLRSPLLLSILTLTYWRAPSSAIRSSSSPEERRAQLFQDYITQRFIIATRADCSLTDQQTSERWLSILAQKLQEKAVAVFQLERLQYDWLPTWTFRTLARLALPLGASMAITAISAFVITFSSLLTDAVMWPTYIITFIIWTISMISLTPREIKLAEQLTWSWRSVRECFRLRFRYRFRASHLATGYLVVTVTVIPILLVSALDSIVEAIVLLLVCFILLILIVGLFSGMKTAPVPVHRQANDGLKASFRHAAVAGLGGGLIFALATLSVFGVYRGWHLGMWTDTASVGLLVAMGFALAKGLVAALQHCVLRLVLWVSGCAPLRYTRWLEQMTRQRLLYRIGGGYVFIHPMLQSYFARLEAGPRRPSGDPID